MLRPRTPPPSASAPGTVPTASAPTSTPADIPSPSDPLLTSKHPIVQLEAPAISDSMAARLAMCLLGHILFLKGQVPFPLMQLGRMPGVHNTTGNRAAAKRREDLLASVDLLAAHLYSTFTALSAALAKRADSRAALAKRRELVVSSPSALASTLHSRPQLKRIQRRQERQPEEAHLVIVLGPSAGAPRARIVLALEGLEVRILGEEEDVELPGSRQKEGKEGRGKENADAISRSSVGSKPVTTKDGVDEKRRKTERVPLSMITSPPSTSLSSSASSMASHSACSRSEFESDSGEDAEDATATASTASECDSDDGAPASTDSDPDSPSEHVSDSESDSDLEPVHDAPIPDQEDEHWFPQRDTEHALRAAERLMSRVLAVAMSAADGQGDLSAELAPTQTHILLRAPRRFDHPAWIARQNLARGLDPVLHAFLQDRATPAPASEPPTAAWDPSADGGAGSGSTSTSTLTSTSTSAVKGFTLRSAGNAKTGGGKARLRGPKVEGVRVRCGWAPEVSRPGAAPSLESNPVPLPSPVPVPVHGSADGPVGEDGVGDGGEEQEGEDKEEDEEDEIEEDEEDEMIWWSWDGRIVGFADW